MAIGYAERRVNLDGGPVQLAAIEYRTLAELASNAGRVLTYEHLLRRVWRLEPDADLRSMRTAMSSLRCKLGDDGRGANLHLHRAPRRLPDAERGGVSVEPCLTARGRPDGEAWWRLPQLPSIVHSEMELRQPGVGE